MFSCDPPDILVNQHAIVHLNQVFKQCASVVFYYLLKNMSVFMYAASVTIQAWSPMLDCLQECVEIGSAFYFIFFCRASQCLSYMPGNRGEE